MRRRDLRLRKEYLLQKQREEIDRKKQERRAKVKECLEEGKKLPGELADDTELVKDLFFNENIELETTFESEYSEAGEPRILVTTSRGPSAALHRFAKKICRFFPNAQKTNRGNYVIDEVLETAKKSGMTDLVILQEQRGTPSTLVVCHLPLGPTATFSISNIQYTENDQESKSVSEAAPHLVFDGFSSKLGHRVTEILKHLFPVPKDDARRIVSFQNKADFISIENNVYTWSKTDTKEKNQILLRKEGLSFDLKLYSIALGTPELDTNPTEWVLHSFTNTSDRQLYL